MSRILLTIGLALISQAALSAETRPDREAGAGLVPGAIPGTVRLAGTSTSLGVGGRLESHATLSDVNFGPQQAGRDRLRFAQIPVAPGNADKNQFRFNSRDSRLWFQLFRPGQSQDLNVYFEFDMTEEPDSYQFNVRHAYVNLGSLLAGRTYTTFIDSAVLPDVDSGSAPGEITLKRNQLRWVHRFGDGGMELAVAVEDTDSHVVNPGTDTIENYDRGQRPALASRLTWQEDWGQFSVATMLRSLRWQQDGKQLSQWAGGFGLSGRIEMGAVNNLRFMANYGNGLGRYITLGAYADASVTDDFSELDLHPVFSVLAAYQHYWHAEWRSTFSLSVCRVPACLAVPARC